ncbi:MAG: hypothetical protein QXX30_03925 [Candidatus Aenigmatarchaeota archaeon]
MKEEKIAISITYIFGIVVGFISYFLNNYILCIASSVILYFGLYLTFRKIFTPEKFLSETALGYFGLWFIIWTILLNLIG